MNAERRLHDVFKALQKWRDAGIASKEKFVWQFGILAFGLSTGFFSSLILINTADLANHPLWEKVAIVAAITLFGGPAMGWVWGHVMWMMKPFWESAQRIADLERRVEQLEHQAQQRSD